MCSKLSAERPVDALKLSHASGIPIEKLAGELFEERGHKPQSGADRGKLGEIHLHS